MKNKKDSWFSLNKQFKIHKKNAFLLPTCKWCTQLKSPYELLSFYMVFLFVIKAINWWPIWKNFPWVILKFSKCLSSYSIIKNLKNQVVDFSFTQCLKSRDKLFNILNNWQSWRATTTITLVLVISLEACMLRFTITLVGLVFVSSFEGSFRKK